MDNPCDTDGVESPAMVCLAHPLVLTPAADPGPHGGAAGQRYWGQYVQL